MLETPEETGRLQELLDRSAAGAGPYLRDIITDERRLSATALCERLPGMRLLVVATVTADGRPLAGPVDGYQSADSAPGFRPPVQAARPSPAGPANAGRRLPRGEAQPSVRDENGVRQRVSPMTRTYGRL